MGSELVVCLLSFDRYQLSCEAGVGMGGWERESGGFSRALAHYGPGSTMPLMDGWMAQVQQMCRCIPGPSARLLRSVLWQLSARAWRCAGQGARASRELLGF